MIAILKGSEGKDKIIVGLTCGAKFTGKVLKVENGIVTMLEGPSHAQSNIYFDADRVSFIQK